MQTRSRTGAGPQMRSLGGPASTSTCPSASAGLVDLICSQGGVHLHVIPLLSSDRKQSQLLWATMQTGLCVASLGLCAGASTSLRQTWQALFWADFASRNVDAPPAHASACAELPLPWPALTACTSGARHQCSNSVLCGASRAISHSPARGCRQWSRHGVTVCSRSDRIAGPLLTAELPEAKDGSDWLLPEPIWKLTPVGSVPVWPLDLITLYAVT